jgi:hypothetical protein
LVCRKTRVHLGDQYLVLRSKINKHATLCQRNLLTKSKFNYQTLLDRTKGVGIRSSKNFSGIKLSGDFNPAFSERGLKVGAPRDAGS